MKNNKFFKPKNIEERRNELETIRKIKKEKILYSHIKQVEEYDFYYNKFSRRLSKLRNDEIGNNLQYDKQALKIIKPLRIVTSDTLLENFIENYFDEEDGDEETESILFDTMTFFNQYDSVFIDKEVITKDIFYYYINARSLHLSRRFGMTSNYRLKNERQNLLFYLKDILELEHDIMLIDNKTRSEIIKIK